MRASLISARSAEAAEHCSGAVLPRRRGIAAGPADAGHRYRGECQIDTAGYIYHWICCLRLQGTSQVLEKAGNNWRREGFAEWRRTYSGSLIFCSKALYRGSSTKLPKSGSPLIQVIPSPYTLNDRSSQAKARSESPRAPYTMAIQ